ncbi:helix-hairpin-helix domain-containing protein [Bacillus sp. B15-48]|uniref:helix-hairpin-helix domain-containing protein n=1 Tax=Bacillus sp. B15-48 TaxID=1548601 RepID=UPI00193ECB98|nr:helix-hairpin-helix domain-containing protein [Bacillus sp. B15-48]MBM4762360.1 hypothetical protein [Bacillus sp. B15-48]
MVDWLNENKRMIIAVFIVLVFLAYGYHLYSVDQGVFETNEEWGLPEITEEKPQNMESRTEEIISKVVMMAEVKGAVANPGVYEVDESERIIQLIEKAGGLTKDADSSAINFALKVADEMSIYVPIIGEEAPAFLSEDFTGGVSLSSETNSKINLNSATASELETLPGIGPAKSAAIIEFRETNGPFKSIDELKLISGIGEKTFEKLQDFISVK